MRHGRAKQARRTLQFFERAAGIRPPYHLLVDGTFVIAVLKYKLPWQDRFDKLLQHAHFDLAVCSSTITELKALQAQTTDGSMFIEAIQWCKDNCEVIDEVPSKKDISSSDSLSEAAADILSVAVSANVSDETQQKHVDKPQKRYFCATQDEELLHQLRQYTIPIIRLARGSVLLLEQPSKAAAGTVQRQERQKWTQVTTEPEKKLVELVKQHNQETQKQSTQQQQPRHQRKKSKAKGPNPLSCKKRSADAPKSENKRKRTK